MSWERLATRLNSLPRVLAGPMLRKVTPESVNVWFALRLPARVMSQKFAAHPVIGTGFMTAHNRGTSPNCAAGRNFGQALSVRWARIPAPAPFIVA